MKIPSNFFIFLWRAVKTLFKQDEAADVTNLNAVLHAEQVSLTGMYSHYTIDGAMKRYFRKNIVRQRSNFSNRGTKARPTMR
jgi:hypothetical protein